LNVEVYLVTKFINKYFTIATDYSKFTQIIMLPSLFIPIVLNKVSHHSEGNSATLMPFIILNDWITLNYLIAKSLINFNFAK